MSAAAPALVGLHGLAGLHVYELEKIPNLGMAWFKADAFTRYLCWFVSGTLNAEAVVSLDLVAKS